MTLLSWQELKAKGIRFSRQHLCRLVREGKFPRPIKLGEVRVAWVEQEVDAWIRERMAERKAA